MTKLFSKAHKSSVHSTTNNMPLLLSMLTVAAVFTMLLSFVFSTIKYEYEEKIGSLLWALTPEQDREERITIIAIDEHSLAEVGSWPWSRSTMADLSNRLAEYGASLQLYDVVFPEAKSNDSKFRDALIQNNGVLAQVPVFDNQSTLRNGYLSGALENTRCQFPLPSADNYLANSSTLAAPQVGHIAPIIDQDGMIRKQPPLVCIDGRVYPSLALAGLLNSLGKNAPSISIKQDKGALTSSWKVAIDSYFGLSIPIDDQGNMRISYRQSPDSFQVVSAASILNGSAPKALLENSWTLIGATAFGLGDVVPTPHSGTTPGVELQARLLSNLLDGRTPYTPSFSNYLMFLEGLIAAAILLLLTYTRIAVYTLPLAAIVLPITAWAIHSYLLAFDIWLGWLNVALFALVSGILFSLADHHILRNQHFRIFSHLSSYLPKSVAQSLVNKSPTGAIEASRHDLILMCADLRNFSAYEESRPPEEAAALLHCFFVEATNIIEEFGGQVEEYKGDSLLASWPAKHAENTSVETIAAANALQDMLANIIPQRPPKGLEPLALGIGIEKGPTLVGSIGPMHRRNHTLLGDTVTIVLRIQEMTQDLAQPILVGECLARDLHGELLESQGSFLLDGLTTPHVLFAPRAHHIDPLTDQEASHILRVVKG